MSAPVYPCGCGGAMTPAVRFGPGETPLPLLACWDCGHESLPLYYRTAGERNGVRTEQRVCARCGSYFWAPVGQRRPRYCGLVCSGAANARRRLERAS